MGYGAGFAGSRIGYAMERRHQRNEQTERQARPAPRNQHPVLMALISVIVMGMITGGLGGHLMLIGTVAVITYVYCKRPARTTPRA